MPRSFLFRLITSVSLSFASTMASAQDAADQCTAVLQAQRAALAAIQQDVERNGVDAQTVSRMTSWADNFHREVNDPSLGDHIEGMAVGTGTSVAATLIAGGPVGWGAVGVGALGALMGSGYLEGRALLQTVASWSETDANTAFYQYLIDYAEYGRVQSVEDAHLQQFLTQHGNILRQITGTAPPMNNPQQLHLYLQANSDELLLFFGFFEENSPGNTFPRWRFPATQGRYGPNRLDVGYYKNILGGRIAEDLRALDAEIAALQAACDTDEPTAANNTIPACGTLPPMGQQQACTCSISQTGSVWGTDSYTGDSDICTAAVHAGVLRPSALAAGGYGWSGTVRVATMQGCPYYESTSRNGITTSSYGDWGGGFYFPAVQRGLCDEQSAPAAGVWYCPSSIGGNTDLTCHCSPAATQRGGVWGSLYYTGDSSICRAALHAGAVGVNGGTVRVIRLGPLDSYESTTSNGVTTSSYGAWGGSIGFP